MEIKTIRKANKRSNAPNKADIVAVYSKEQDIAEFYGTRANAEIFIEYQKNNK